MTQVKFTSRADAVFERLESDILTGVYKKGDLVTECGLSAALNVSRTPVREAIRRLEQENLLKETSKGHEVVGISYQDILDIYDIRIQIEGVAARLAAENATETALNEMQEAIDLQEFYTFKNVADKIKTSDSRFHEIIFKNTGSAIYEYILSSLHRKVQLTRKVSMSENGRANQAAQEHREIFEAIRSKNGALAEQLMVKHIKNAKSNIKRIN